MTKTKLKKKVFEPTQVDRLVFQVQDMAEEVYDMVGDNEELHGRMDELVSRMNGLSDDVGRLEHLVGILQAHVNSLPLVAPTSTTTYTASVDCQNPWWKRWLGR